MSQLVKKARAALRFSRVTGSVRSSSGSGTPGGGATGWPETFSTRRR
jgi:hypothetical protein